MAGLAEILDENARLRRELSALHGRLVTTEGQLETSRDELMDARAELANREAMLEEIRRRAEYLAHQLELAQLRRAGPASQRYVPEGQDLLPFAVEVVPPPRAPVAVAQSDEEASEPPMKRPTPRSPPGGENRCSSASLGRPARPWPT